MNNLSAQTKRKVDSLTIALNQYLKEDTVRLKLLLGLASQYENGEPSKAMEYVEIAIKLSERLGYDFWIGKSYQSKVAILLIRGELEEAKLYCQKSRPFFEKAPKSLDEIGICQMRLGIIAIRSGNHSTALAYSDSALAIFEKVKNRKMQVKTMTNIGIINYRLGNSEKALALFQDALKENKIIQDKDNFRLIYTNMADVYHTWGNYTLSLDYSLQSLSLAEELGDLRSAAKTYNSISGIYYNILDKKEARNYLLKALDIYQRLNDKSGIALMMANLAASYEDDQKAVDELKKAMEYCKEHKQKRTLAYTHQNIAYHYANLKDYRSAYFHVQQGLEIEKGINRAQNLILLNNYGANILIHCSDEELMSFGIEPKDRYTKAKEYLDTVFALDNNENPRELQFTWQYLSEIQEKQQNYSQAYESYKKYVALKDSTSNEDILKQVTRKEIQYGFDKKETEFKFQQQLSAGELEKERLLTFQQEQALTLSRQTLTLKEQALALSNKAKDLVHLDFLKEQAEKQEKAQELSLSQEREKGKTQELSLSQEREKGKEQDLKMKNLELYAKQKQNLSLMAFAALLLLGLGALLYFYSVLKKQKNIIAQQNELNEHTIAILSHDIKEPLLGVKLLLKKLNKEDPFVAQASQSLENQINAVNSILNNLLKMKKVALNKKDKNVAANVNEVVQGVLQELSVAIRSKDLSIQNELADNVTLPISPEKLQIILHNLLSNAVKYSFMHKSIRIFQEGKGICIQDFGVGLSPEQRSKLMREVTASQVGTNQERGNGLGLFLVGALLQSEPIRLVFDSPDMGGTIVKVVAS